MTVDAKMIIEIVVALVAVLGADRGIALFLARKHRKQVELEHIKRSQEAGDTYINNPTKELSKLLTSIDSTISKRHEKVLDSLKRVEDMQLRLQIINMICHYPEHEETILSLGDEYILQRHLNTYIAKEISVWAKSRKINLANRYGVGWDSHEEKENK